MTRPDPAAVDWSGPMRRAIDLANGQRTHPNPTVGCVIVADGRVVGEGWHAGPGADHAEVVALRAAGDAARGATAVVSLEPCSHHGRTPPCVDALLGAGVARVVVGATDPDPRVAGAGVRALRAAGIEVMEGVLVDEAEAVDPAYFHHRRTGRPLVTLKLAATLDGSTAAADGSSQWITGPDARADAHRLRAAHDAVMVGAGTVRGDDPTLDVRLDGYDGSQPRPVVVTGAGPLPPEAKVLGRKPLVVGPRPIPGWPEPVVVAGTAGRSDPAAVLAAVADAGLLSVLVEGGPSLAGSLWDAGLVDRVVLYLGALVGGGPGRPVLAGRFPTIDAATPVQVVEVRTIGPDVRITFEPA